MTITKATWPLTTTFHLRSKIDKISDSKKYIETIYGGGYKLNV